MKPLVLASFEVRGNQYDPEGNPIPWTRTTARQKWQMMRTKDGRPTQYARYIGFKDYIIESIPLDLWQWIRDVVWPEIREGNVQYYVDCAIQFAGKQHGDTGNVVKGIEDALFPKKSKRVPDGPDDLLAHGRLALVRDCAGVGFIQVQIHGPYPRDVFCRVELCEFDL